MPSRTGGDPGGRSRPGSCGTTTCRPGPSAGRHGNGRFGRHLRTAEPSAFQTEQIPATWDVQRPSQRRRSPDGTPGDPHGDDRRGLERRPSSREVLGPEPQQDAVLDDEPAVVAPDRVLGAARGECPGVAGDDPGEERRRVRSREAVLDQRGGVPPCARGTASSGSCALARARSTWGHGTGHDAATWAVLPPAHHPPTGTLPRDGPRSVPR
jgi:hypothetical protein